MLIQDYAVKSQVCSVAAVFKAKTGILGQHKVSNVLVKTSNAMGGSVVFLLLSKVLFRTTGADCWKIWLTTRSTSRPAGRTLSIMVK